eukprot:CAMPEP_0201123552 /NCGR_PEP_ID=MMETSP0850-20130426/7509_1 /ASSEMBLY_ACC=CAM_ASM_000622 /TAXON_ID=183588 /ORGANISM="Pseudo-nitzschia fraudulenta, Strain WWA7" /LENGTH=131 /DNA_ID=CAMNT_0047390525 /DNA_START=93 /DNA_END=485 /DNA_ORIENTATION=+
MGSFTKPIMLLASCTLSYIRAFGPRLEPISRSCYASRLLVSEAEPDNRHDRKESSPLSKSFGFEFVGAPFDDLDDFSLLFDRGLFDDTFPLFQEQGDAMAIEAFDENESLDFDVWDNCGDDCKECEIPKDW